MKKIGDVRRERGKTQEELAYESGVKLATLQKLERGASDPRGATAETICRIARALGMHAEDFVLDDDD